MLFNACVGLENDEYVRQIEGYLPTAEVRNKIALAKTSRK